MFITTKLEIVDGKVVIPKGIRGYVRAVRWGNKESGFVVDFPDNPLILVPRDSATIESEIKTYASEKSCPQEEDRKISKSKRKKELPPPTTGKGSV